MAEIILNFKIWQFAFNLQRGKVPGIIILKYLHTDE